MMIHCLDSVSYTHLVLNDDHKKSHVAAYIYKIRTAGEDVPVCQKAFIGMHGRSKYRPNRIQHSLVFTGKSPTDQHGHHGNRPTKVPVEITFLVEYHINSFHARKSHYSLRHNPDRQYLPEDLTVSKSHTLFLSQYLINVPYKTYWSIFQNVNIEFGYPRSDTC